MSNSIFNDKRITISRHQEPQNLRIKERHKRVKGGNNTATMELKQNNTILICTSNINNQTT